MSKLYPCKATITHNEYLQLMGLLLLSKRNNEVNKRILEAVREIIGEEKDHGHCEDAVWGDYSAEELLEKMEVTVEPPPSSARENHEAS